MKKHDILKTIQLIIYVILALAGIIMLILDKEVFHQISADPVAHLLFLFLWAVFAISFIFVYLDFSFSNEFKKNYRELDFAVHSDPLSGLSNRNSCDAIIDQYAGQKLPENLGCVVFELSSIQETNRLYGHAAGNQLIRDFANILNSASYNRCFVGRNGGNKFLAVFEQGSDESIEEFMKLINIHVQDHNHAHPRSCIQYRHGIAFHEDPSVDNITKLVALADNRLS